MLFRSTSHRDRFPAVIPIALNHTPYPPHLIRKMSSSIILPGSCVRRTSQSGRRSYADPLRRRIDESSGAPQTSGAPPNISRTSATAELEPSPRAWFVAKTAGLDAGSKARAIEKCPCTDNSSDTYCRNIYTSRKRCVQPPVTNPYIPWTSREEQYEQVDADHQHHEFRNNVPQ